MTFSRDRLLVMRSNVSPAPPTPDVSVWLCLTVGTVADAAELLSRYEPTTDPSRIRPDWISTRAFVILTADELFCTRDNSPDTPPTPADPSARFGWIAAMSFVAATFLSIGPLASVASTVPLSFMNHKDFCTPLPVPSARMMVPSVSKLAAAVTSPLPPPPPPAALTITSHPPATGQTQQTPTT